MSSSAIQTRRWSRQEYDSLAEAGIFHPTERVQLLEGEILSITPQNSPHAVTIGKTQRILDRLLGPNVWVRVQMPFIVDPDSEPEPDLAVVPGAPDDYRIEHPRNALLIVEISDTSLHLDRDPKRAIYARAMVPEYWIVNLPDRCVEVYRDPISSPGQPSRYQSSKIVTPNETISPLSKPETAITVSDLLP